MRTNNLRGKSRRLIHNRRIEDRRKVEYEFGSEEWLENIKHHYLAWPKHDRRQQERRTEDRRLGDRRQNTHAEFKVRNHNKLDTHLLLTHEEKKMIAHLFLNDN